jgi:hypothetical protein
MGAILAQSIIHHYSLQSTCQFFCLYDYSETCDLEAAATIQICISLNSKTSSYYLKVGRRKEPFKICTIQYQIISSVLLFP